MNGAHDMGGMMGFGPVQTEARESVFHHSWERRVFAMQLAMRLPLGVNIDQGRHARENMLPGDYLSSGYFEVWLAGLTKMVLERGLVSRDEISAGRSLQSARSTSGPLRADDVERVLTTSRPYSRAAEILALFSVGDTVRAKNIHPAGHTRLPRYVRGRCGAIMAVRGVFVFADSNGNGNGEQPQWLYTVRFAATELWGRDGDPTASVSVDAWESHLAAVP